MQKAHKPVDGQADAHSVFKPVDGKLPTEDDIALRTPIGAARDLTAKRK